MKGCNVCLASKVVYHKPYRNLQSLPVSIHCQKDLSTDFMINLSLLVNCKNNSYNVILVVIDCLIKMVHYKPVKTTMDVVGLAKTIIDIVVWYYSLMESIISNQSLLFTTKIWSLLYYSLDIKGKLSTTFHPQSNGQTKRKNSIIETYYCAFVN